MSVQQYRDLKSCLSKEEEDAIVLKVSKIKVYTPCRKTAIVMYQCAHLVEVELILYSQVVQPSCSQHRDWAHSCEVINGVRKRKKATLQHKFV